MTKRCKYAITWDGPYTTIHTTPMDDPAGQGFAAAKRDVITYLDSIIEGYQYAKRGMRKVTRASVKADDSRHLP